MSRAIVRIFPGLGDTPGLARGLVPGWVQRREGQRQFGWLLTCVWLVLVLFAIYLRGGTWGWPAYFAMVGWHGFTISLVMAPRLRSASLMHRAAIGLATWIFLNALLYVPAGTLMSRLIVPIQTNALLGGGGIRPGEVVLRQGPWLRPSSFRRGDVVAYHIHRRNFPGVYVAEGILIDRILAVPGDWVVMSPDSLTINGTTLDRADQLPLRHVSYVKDEFVLGPDEYLIIPSTARVTIYAREVTGRLPREMSRVSRTDVLGRIVFRTRPFWDAGPINWNDSAQQDERATTSAPAGVGEASPPPPAATVTAPGGPQ